MKKQLFWKIFIPAAAVLTAFLSVFLRTDPGEQAELPEEKYLPAFEPDAPSRIILSWRDAVTTLEFENGIWRVKERENHPADPGKVADFIESVRKVRPLRKAVPGDRETCTVLRVNPEEKELTKIPGVRVRIFASSGTVLRDLTLGLGYFTDPSKAGDAKVHPDGRWMGLVQEDGKQVIPFLASQVFEEHHPIPGSWLSCPTFDRLSDLVRVRFQSEKFGNWMIARISPEEPFASVIPAEKAVSRRKLNELFGILSRHYVYEGLREKDAGNLTKIGSFSTADRSGFLRTLTFYTTDKAKGGVVCKVHAQCKKDDAEGRKRAEAFLNGRDGWLYVIPDKLFETIKSAPAGE